MEPQAYDWSNITTEGRNYAPPVPSNFDLGQLLGKFNFGGLSDSVNKSFGVLDPKTGMHTGGWGSLANIGLAGLSFLESKKNAKSQRRLNNQQYAANQYKMSELKDFRDNTKKAFAQPTGLAASVAV